ncbi:MAG: hypothetical protein JXB00_18555 [Bacteroidales bacterium]|nr:hypothetical protein [Bacteroidales bacterium]
MKHYQIALILLIINACNHQVPYSDTIFLGYYCGECAKNCAIIYKIDRTGVFADTTDSFFSNPDRYDYFSLHQGAEVKDLTYSDFESIIKLLPDNLKKYPGIVGCPNCYDQCGIFISYKGKDIRLDPVSPSDDFKEFSKAFLNLL